MDNFYLSALIVVLLLSVIYCGFVLEKILNILCYTNDNQIILFTRLTEVLHQLKKGD